MSPNVRIFVLAGGSGERFWPMSRSTRPKHLLRLLEDRTLLETTIGRLKGLVPEEQIYVLTNAAQAEGARKAAASLPPGNIVAEPAKRDTAPACALATAIARQAGPGTVCALLPADAMIHDGATFRAQLGEAIATAAARDAILTLGIPPTYPATGFGYLHFGESLGGDLCRVRRFVEKPDRETAARYLESGEYAWNAGIFAWRAEWFQSEAARLRPELARFIEGFPEGDWTEYVREKFPGLPKISVDYAILEKTAEVLAVKAKFDWDDVGSWTSLPAHIGEDAQGNSLRGEGIFHDSRGNIVVSNGRPVALCGVKDLIVVETDDAILVCHRDAAQDIKKMPIPESLR